MAELNCNACEEIRQTSPEFVVNGLTDEMCTSLGNDTGLSPSSGNNDCTDLNNLNDCLVGNSATEIEAYDVCDWKEYMRNFVPNVWTTLKGMICSICGMWTAIHRLECIVNYITQGDTFKITEVMEGQKSYIVAGKGVSFSNVSASGTAGDLNITYVGGGLCRIGGSLRLYTEDFQDRIASANYDKNGVNPTTSKNRDGNTDFHDTNTKPGNYGSELLYEVRVLKSEFPMIDRFFTGVGLNQDGGGFHIDFRRIGAGDYAPGQYGKCDTKTGDPTQSRYSRGHLVPDGWEYIQCRITWIEKLSADDDGAQYSPSGLIGVRLNQNDIPC